MARHRQHRIVHIAAATAAAVACFLTVVTPGASASATLDPFSSRTVTFGTTVSVSGDTTGGEVGVSVRLEQLIAGSWTRVGVADTTDGSGRWTIDFRPQRSGRVRAVQVTGAAPGASPPRAVFVRPVILRGSLSRSRFPFLGTAATWRVLPATYSGVVTAEVKLGTVVAGTSRARVRNGRVTVKLANNGVGSFSARLTLPDRETFEGATSRPVTWVQTGRRIGPGARGPWVRSLRAALVFRGFHVPSGASFGGRMGDSVIAFHKAYGRSRTTTFTADDWKVLTRRKVSVKYPNAADHIEIDKGRQILIKVRDGEAWHIIHVSTGSTGNTPAGTHRIQWKGLWVPSLYGSLLFRSMAFQGAFAIHGYPSVPTYPASHGCVRVPMWIADWLYDHTPVGEPVYIYRGPRPTSVSPGQREGGDGSSSFVDLPELTGVDVAAEADEI